MMEITAIKKIVRLFPLSLMQYLPVNRDLGYTEHRH